MSLQSRGISGVYGKMSSYCSLSQSRCPNCFFFLQEPIHTTFKKLIACIATSDFVEIGKKVDKLLGTGKLCRTAEHTFTLPATKLSSMPIVMT